MLTKVVILLLPAFAFGSIRVYLKVSSPEEGRHVEYLGANVNVVEDKDISSFGLEGDRLREAVKAYTGNLPSHAFLRGPTIIEKGISPNLYLSHNYTEVSRRIIPMTSDIVHYRKEIVNLTNEEVFNDKEGEIVHKTSLSQNVIDKIGVKWLNGDLVSPGDDLDYVFDIVIDECKNGIKNLTFKAAFAKNIDKDVGVAISKDVELSLKPKAKAGISLKAERVILYVEIDYTVSLDGDIVCYFPEGHKGQNIWRFDVNEVLKAANVRNTLEISQIMKATFYTKPQLIVVVHN